MIDGISEPRMNRPLIHDILWREWDPIGLKNIPGAPEDDYDRYIDGVCDLLADPHQSQQQIAAYLLDIQTRRMRLRASDAARERCRRAAQSLIALRRAD